jgi:hypothetical protein
LADKLPRDELALYALVWRRAVASQMADALALRTRLDIEGSGVTLRANGSRITAPGWLAAQRDPEGAPPSREEAAAAAAAEATAGADDNAASADADDVAGDSASSSSGASDAPFDEATATLPALKAGAGVRAVSCDATERSTLPPARFTEGRLVKALEAAGVGRPSTYAPTLRLLLTRGYVAKPHGGGALAPTPLGRVVSCYLGAYFAAYGPPFTARMEAQLDDVAAGALPWRAALGAFWGPFTQAAAAAAAVPAPDVIDALDAALATAMFPGGEQQRVAIARAVAKRPELLLCDEPTGALDFQTGKLVLDVIEKVNREIGTTTLVITHNASIAGMADRVVRLRSGEISEERRNLTRLSPSELVW